MTVRGVRLLAVVLLGALAVTSGFSQGIYWESVTKGGPGQEGESPAKSYAVPKMFKHESAGKGMILRADREMLYSIDYGAKSYWEMTFAEMEAMMKKAKAQMDQAMEQLKNLPPDQRKMMEKQMQGMMGLAGGGGTIEVTKTGEKKSISGYGCSKYVVKSGGETSMVFWVTKDIKGFAAMQRDWAELSRRFMSMSGGWMSELANAMEKIDGFPMQTEFGKVVTVVSKVESRSMPSAEFEVPSGYKKEKAPAMGEEGMD